MHSTSVNLSLNLCPTVDADLGRQSVAEVIDRTGQSCRPQRSYKNLVPLTHVYGRSTRHLFSQMTSIVLAHEVGSRYFYNERPR